MNSRVNYLICSSLLCLAFAAKAAPPTQLQGVAEKPIKLSLDANPTTGYQWIVSQLPAGLLLIPGSYSPSAECKPARVGCQGKQDFYLMSHTPGTYTLKLIYGRTFEPSHWQENSIQVVVSPQPQD